jgi:hypothetical protein
MLYLESQSVGPALGFDPKVGFNNDADQFVKFSWFRGSIPYYSSDNNLDASVIQDLKSGLF